MFSTKFLTLLLLTTTTTASFLFTQGQARFLTNQDENFAKGVFGEFNDLNKNLSSITETNQHENNADSVGTSYKHHDEDMPRLQNNLELEESPNYDVEILESADIKKENMEIEERFRGNAVQFNTDTFFAENIEVHGGDDIHQRSHMILTMILLIVALISIALYAVLVIWRSHLEQRYGMRELLVNDDDDYCQQQNYNNNSRNAAGHFSIVQL